MTKENFIEKVSTAAGMTKKDAGTAVDAFILTLENAFKEGEDVTFVGFGKFGSKDRPERTGHDPRTGNSIKIPAKRVPYFKPSEKLTEKLN